MFGTGHVGTGHVEGVNELPQRDIIIEIGGSWLVVLKP